MARSDRSMKVRLRLPGGLTGVSAPGRGELAEWCDGPVPLPRDWCGDVRPPADWCTGPSPATEMNPLRRGSLARPPGK